MKEKEITVIINGTPEIVTEKKLSFAQIVELAYGHPPEGGYIVYTVTYERGHGNKPEGSIIEGDELRVKEGMLINVTRTDKS